jgi:dTDP-4-dehydrorhamnose reductase
MVIGNGMIAARFESYKTNDNIIIFASGVSNSKNTDTTAYDRELTLLQAVIENNKDKTLVYFSTCSIYDPGEKESLYVLHKIKIEELIQQKVTSYYIFRVSNLAGKSGNPNTLLNFFYHHIVNRINFDLWSNSGRNLIDTDDMFLITDYIIKQIIFQNQIINIANPHSYAVIEIVAAIESLLGIRANYISIPKGSQFSIDISLILPVIQKLNINFGETYLSDLIKKYYLHK